MTFNYVLSTSSEEKRFPNYLLLYKIFLRVNLKKLFLCSTIICVSRYYIKVCLSVFLSFSPCF